MKITLTRILALAAICSFSAAAASALPRVPAPKSIYGTDNRQDYFAASPADRKLADSVASLWKDVMLQQEGGNYRLLTDNFGEKMNLCPGEPFSEQPLGAFCSGSLVGKDLLMTAGHCIRDDFDCAGAKIVFGFAVTSSGGKAPETIPAGNVYGCKEIVTRALEPKGKDYALIRLDRAVQDRAPLAISRNQKVQKGDKVFVIGYPVGIPLKVSGGSTVRDASNPAFFVA
ncbi:MAG TPA: serine protease, partial [Elusimicrobiales bacterium]|nr:serine protease [Elusimicrobiales bacterium]